MGEGRQTYLRDFLREWRQRDPKQDRAHRERYNRLRKATRNELRNFHKGDHPIPGLCGFCYRPFSTGEQAITESRPTGKNGKLEIWEFHENCKNLANV